MSIFDLTETGDELKMSNAGMARMKYEQVTSRRGALASVNRGFAGSQQQFEFSRGPGQWWIPSKSYMRFRCTLLQGTGGAVDTPLNVADKVAPTMNLCPALYQSLEFKINNQTIHTVADHVPQVDTLFNRQNRSKSWLDGAGESTGWWNASQSNRASQVSSDGLIINSQPETLATIREKLGFDVGGAAERNTASYAAATGIITFAANAGAGLPADVRTLFPVGSYFMYNSGTTVPASAGVPLKVITGVGDAPVGSTTTIVVEKGLALDEDGAPASAAVFSRNILDTGSEPSRRVGGFELMWQPPLAIFGYDGALPTGDYSMLLTPQAENNFRRYAVETLTNKTPGIDYKFEIDSVYLYIATVDGDVVNDKKFYIDLECVDAQSKTLLDSDGFSSEQFTVSPATYQLSVAFQQTGEGLNTDRSATKFKFANSAELRLNRFHIQYAGLVKPSPDWDPSYKFDAKNVDYTTQLWGETMYDIGMMDIGSSPESLVDWQNRGLYLSYMWPKSENDKSTNVLIYFGFQSPTLTGNERLLVFSHHRKVAIVTIENNQVREVLVQDA